MSEQHPQPSPAGVPGAVTDPSRVLGGDITYHGHGGDPVNGYLARPAGQGEGPFPAMVVIHEAGGLGEHIRDVVNRFANIGYVSLGVDLYTREGGPPDTSNLEALFARLFAMSDEVVLRDLEGAADALRARGDTTGKVGCIGFCMGGRLTLLFACSSEKLSAAIDCWGGFIDSANGQERTTDLRPNPPLEMAGHVHCPLYAAVGAEDHNPSPEIGERLREELSKSPHAEDCGVEIYDGAAHAFFADYRPTYRPEPAAKLWERIVPFLDGHLKGGS